MPIERGMFDGGKLTFQLTAPDGIVFEISVMLENNDKLDGTVQFKIPDGTVVKGKLTLKREVKPTT
jgi:hypothetical protein